MLSACDGCAFASGKDDDDDDDGGRDDNDDVISGAALGAVLLIFAITINSTTSNILTEAKSGGTVTQKSESGIWLSKRSKTGDVDSWQDSKPTYCNQDEDGGSCAAPKDSDCCKALASKCKTAKAFAVIGESEPQRRAPFAH